ncbi:acyl-CoA N-acyltransferase [Phanerochaete sordida]|uniref:N-acetyltransferase 9-like protein n=1 Tax=Phanerochaete sordida TaxID=48140 RepID=A0A9P3G4X0_9APHY|nr:acyl-CoA N-acyltransferase [Phanerochaete sordida]
MRANENTMLVGDQIVLVPYREEHVAKYHEWMASTELQELTASEPLTLEEEYEMQRKWQQDEDKLTFIVCARGDGTGESQDLQSALTMIGDVNLFLKGDRADPEFEAEVEIMIAERAYRRRGFAATALQMLLSYATAPDSPRPLPVPKERLVVRIGEKNEPSMRLFEKLGFAITKRVAVFEEVEMRFQSEGAPGSWVAGELRPYSSL